MPRKTPVKELLQKEETVVSSPLRRSSRISNNSPVPTKVVTRRSSATESTSTPKATRGRRSSFTQELEATKENETESKTTKTLSRTRKGSFSSKNGEDSAAVEETVTKRTTRASSVAKEDTPEARKPTTRRRRSTSQEVEVNEEAPVAKITRSRSGSVNKKNEKSEELEKPVTEVGTPVKSPLLDAIEEAIKESYSPDATESKTSAAKKKRTDNLKVDLELSVIKETSLTEEDVVSEEEGKSSLPLKHDEDNKNRSETKTTNKEEPTVDTNGIEDLTEVESAPENKEKRDSIVTNTTVEDKSSLPLKHEEDKQGKSMPDIEEHESDIAETQKSESIASNDQPLEIKPGVEIGEKEKISPIPNNVENTSEVENPAISIQKPPREKSVTPQKVVTPIENDSTILKPSNENNEAQVTSPQGNKENVCPRNQSVESECEPMEVDESEPENSFSVSLNNSQSPIKTAKVKDVGKELEIAEKVTDQIDEFLKEEIKITNSPNITKRSRLSLNRSRSEKEHLTKEFLKNEALSNHKEIEESVTTQDKQENDNVVKDSCIAPHDSKEDTTEAKTTTVSQAESQIDEDTEESFHLDLTETKSLDDSDKVEEDIKNNTAPDVKENDSSTINETVASKNKEENQLQDSVSEKDTDQDVKLEDAGEKASDDFKAVEEVVEKQVEEHNEVDLNESKAVEDAAEAHVQEHHEKDQTCITIKDVEKVAIKKTNQMSPVNQSTPKTNTKENIAEDATDMEPVEVTIETDEELEISKNDSDSKDCTEPASKEVNHEDVQKETNINGSSCIILESDPITIEDTRNQTTLEEKEGNESSCIIVESASIANEEKEGNEGTIETEAEEELINEADKSMETDEGKEINEEDLVGKEESVNVESEVDKTNLSNVNKSTENESPNKSPNLKNTEVVHKKSPVNVIIKSDILIHPATCKDGSSSPKEKSTGIRERGETSVIVENLKKNDETLEEADTTQDDVFLKEDYKSPQKKNRSKLPMLSHTDASSSDEETNVVQQKAVIVTDSKYVIASDKKETTRKSTSSTEVVIVSDNEKEDEESASEVDAKQVAETKEIKNEANDTTENNSTTEDNFKLKKPSPDKTCIVMQQNLKAGDDKERRLSDRIHKVVDLFCAGIKNTNDVSINVSLEFTGYFSDSENETKPKKDTVEVALTASATKNDSKEQVVDLPKGSKRRKLYHPEDHEVLNLTEANEQEVEEDSQEKSMKSEKRAKSKNKKSTTFDESNNSSSSPQKSETNQGDDDVFTSPAKRPRPYKDTPYKSSKSSKKSPGDKQEGSMKSKDESPAKRKKKATKEADEEGWNLFKQYFSSVSESNSEGSESEHDSTWGPSREVSLSDLDSTSDDLDETTDFSLEDEEESLIIKSPIPGKTEKTESSETHSADSEPSFTFSVKSSKSCRTSPDNTTFNIKSPSPSKSKKRKSFQSEDEEQVEEAKKEKKHSETSEVSKKAKKGRKSLNESFQSEDEVEETSLEAKKEGQELETSEKNEQPKKGKKSLKANTLKPSMSNTKVAPAMDEKKSKKRTHPPTKQISEDVKAKKTLKKGPEIIVSEVPTNRLKVSTKECSKTEDKAPAKKSRKTAKAKYLKPSTTMATDAWEVKQLF